MANNIDWHCISELIEQQTKQSFTLINTRPVSGGCINSAYILHGDTTNYFIKLNQLQLLPMFEAEFAGLQEIAETKTIRVPQPIVCGTLSDKAFIILEMISLSPGNKHSDNQLGQQLAALHQIQYPFFGWHQNNTIGSTEQINDISEEWSTFWRTNRIGFQLSLAKQNGYGGKLIRTGEKLCESIHYFFDNHQPHPSMLHGDLWSGNAAVTEQNEPVIYDPASYYGDRETDIAMTELFGGFSCNFYDSYNEAYPLPPEYNTRKTLYNLYHILNHLNLFGAGYQHQAQSMIDSLLAQLR
jgi:fructosamine-3-kinase